MDITRNIWSINASLQDVNVAVVLSTELQLGAGTGVSGLTGPPGARRACIKSGVPLWPGGPLLFLSFLHYMPSLDLQLAFDVHVESNNLITHSVFYLDFTNHSYMEHVMRAYAVSRPPHIRGEGGQVACGLGLVRFKS